MQNDYKHSANTMEEISIPNTTNWQKCNSEIVNNKNCSLQNAVHLPAMSLTTHSQQY